MARNRKHGLIVGGVVLALLATACGSDDSSSKAPTTTVAASTTAPAASVAEPDDSTVDTTAPTAAPETVVVADTEAAPVEEVSGTLVWWTNWTLEQADAFAEEFNKVQPDVNVEVVRSDDVQQVERFATETATGNVTADVITVGFAGYAKGWAAEGLLMNYQSPEADVLPSTAYGADYSYYVNARILTGICYNTEYLEEEGVEPPTSWEDLADPKYKGMQTMQDVLKSGSGAFALPIDLKDYWKDDARWEAFMQGWGANDVTFQTGYIEAQQAVVQGAFGIMPICYPDYVQPLIDDGAPIVWVPVEPVIEVFFGWAMPAAAPNPTSATAFTDFMLSELGQTAISDIVGQVPVRPGVAFPATTKQAEGIPTHPGFSSPTAQAEFDCCKDQYIEMYKEWFSLR